MEVVRLAVQQRSQTGKGVARRLRRAGMLPAVIYGHGESEAIAMAYTDLMHIRRSGAGENTLLELAFEGDQPKTANAILREIQIDPVSQAPLHVDLYRVQMDESIKVTVPLEFVNEPEDRFKAAQVMLTPLIREIEVECLPQDIPRVVTVDLAALEVGDVLRAAAVPLPPGITLITDSEEPIVTTEVMREEAAEEVSGEGAVAAEMEGGEAAAEEEPPAER